jgi:prephenate dehydrogenase
MGWVTMSERDLQRIEALTDVLAGRRTVAAAATVLAVSERQMYRLLAKYEFGADADLRAIGGRAMREMTRLGSSPYPMWRDVALSNTERVEHALLALEQRIAHMRGILQTPALRDEFDRANQFRAAALP